MAQYIGRKLECDYSKLPHSNGNSIIWKESVGYSFPFVIDNEISGIIHITDYYIRDKKHYLTLMYKNIKKEICITEMANQKFLKYIISIDEREKYLIGNVVPVKQSKLLIMNQIIRTYKNKKNSYADHEIFYKVKCLDCGYEYYKRRYDFEKTGCISCNTPKIIIEGENDIPTTDPWMIPYFQGGYEEAKQYSSGSGKKIYPVCPDCGKVSNKQRMINNLHNHHGFNCEYCSDGISYPEKFLNSLLQQLNVKYNFQASTDELGFDSCKKKYDFYVRNKSCIIETHGSQHYTRSFFNIKKGRTLKEEQENDKFKRDLALKNGITNYIELDCSQSNIEWIKRSVMSSELPTLFNFNEKDINWERCGSDACKNITKEVCNDYENNLLTIAQLKNKYHLGDHAIQTYLILGNEIGWCKYNKKLNSIYRSPINVYLNGLLIFTGASAMDVSNRLLKEYCIKISKETINKRIRENITLNGLTFERITNERERRSLIYAS